MVVSGFLPSNIVMSNSDKDTLYIEGSSTCLTFTTSMEPDETVPLNIDNSVGVALSNPQLSHGRRKMLDLVNKLHSTGLVILLS